jgi:multiple sugar transport system substrate-binding protein/sorbitol/mannitol transport system substrate-binding protein
VALALLAGTASVAVGQAPLPQIRVAVWSGPEADNLRKVAAEYTAATGNPVEIDEIARDGYLDKLRTTIVGGGSDWDVVYASADWLPSFIAADGLAPLDEYIASMPADFLVLDDLQPGLGNLTFDGQVYGFPSEGDTAWLFYRKDLLEAAGLGPPQTMDEMLQVALALNDPPTRHGMVIGSLTDEAWWDFMHYFWAFGGQLYDPETYEVTVNDEKGVAALTFYSDLLRKHGVVSPDVTTYGYNGILTALQEDKAAMGVEWMAATKDLTTCGTPVCDNLAYQFVPPAVAGEYGFGGSSWGWIIPSGATHKEAGYTFIEWLVGGPGAKMWALNGGIPSNRAALSDPEVVAQIPQFELLAQAMPYRHITPLLTTSDQIVKGMQEAAAAAVAGARTPQEAMDEAAAAIENALAEAGLK